MFRSTLGTPLPPKLLLPRELRYLTSLAPETVQARLQQLMDAVGQDAAEELVFEQPRVMVRYAPVLLQKMPVLVREFGVTQVRISWVQGVVKVTKGVSQQSMPVASTSCCIETILRGSGSCQTLPAVELMQHMPHTHGPKRDTRFSCSLLTAPHTIWALAAFRCKQE